MLGIVWRGASGGLLVLGGRLVSDVADGFVGGGAVLSL